MSRNLDSTSSDDEEDRALFSESKGSFPTKEKSSKKKKKHKSHQKKKKHKKSKKSKKKRSHKHSSDDSDTDSDMPSNLVRSQPASTHVGGNYMDELRKKTRKYLDKSNLPQNSTKLDTQPEAKKQKLECKEIESPIKQHQPLNSDIHHTPPQASQVPVTDSLSNPVSVSVVVDAVDHAGGELPSPLRGTSKLKKKSTQVLPNNKSIVELHKFAQQSYEKTNKCITPPVATRAPSEDVPEDVAQLVMIRNQWSERYQDDRRLAWGQCGANQFEKIQLVGEGTYGQVFKARDKRTGELVALKKLRLENEREGFPITTVREIRILNDLNHINVVQLKEIVTDTVLVDCTNGQSTESLTARPSSDLSYYLVFEYCEHDLMGLLECETFRPTQIQVASIMKQLMLGLAHCHAKSFLHRDIKCSNVLLNAQGQVKLADFGLSRMYVDEERDRRPYTNRVITLWYRPPELLLGDERYAAAVDCWSCGCILGELFDKRPLFKGCRENDQLELISKLCGSPNPSQWPLVTQLPHYQRWKQATPTVHQRKVRSTYAHLPSEALDLLDGLLTLDPRRRTSARQATESPWLKPVQPRDVPPPELPTAQDCHELWAKNHRRPQRSGIPSSKSAHSTTKTAPPSSKPSTAAAAPVTTTTTTVPALAPGGSTIPVIGAKPAPSSHIPVKAPGPQPSGNTAFSYQLQRPGGGPNTGHATFR